MENDISDKNGFLGRKKLRLNDLIKKYKDEPKKLKKINTNSESNSNSNSDPDSEYENYKNIISGKINVNNLINDKNKIKELKEKEIKQSNLDEDKKHKSNLKYLMQKQHELGFLPKPLNNKNDNSINYKFFEKKFNEEEFFNNYKSNLINPDNISVSEVKINPSDKYDTLDGINVKSTNVVDLNVHDLIDKNWELNYLARLQKKDLYKTNIGEITKDHKKTNHLRSMLSDYKSKKDIDEDFDIKIKSSKISTKAKYGW